VTSPAFGTRCNATLARATFLAAIFGLRHYGAIAGPIAFGVNAARAVGRRVARVRRTNGRPPMTTKWKGQASGQTGRSCLDCFITQRFFGKP
jgi:hypothetical protein